MLVSFVHSLVILDKQANSRVVKCTFRLSVALDDVYVCTYCPCTPAGIASERSDPVLPIALGVS